MFMGLHQPKQGFHHLTIRNGTYPKDLPYKNLVEKPTGVFRVQNDDLPMVGYPHKLRFLW